MATEVVVTVRSSGGDYSTVALAEAGEQRNLVTADEISVIECYDDWPSGLSGAVTVTGWTTDSTRYVRLTVAPGHRHNGTPKTGFWMTAASATNGAALLLSQAHTRLEYFDVDQTGAANGTTAIALSASTCQVSWCNARTSALNTAGAGYYVLSGGASSTIRYCLAYGGASTAVGYLPAAACTILNCTAAGGYSRGFSGGSVSAALKNCVAQGNTTAYAGTFDSTNSTNNATSNSTDDAPGGSSVTGIVSGNFANAAGNDFHLAAGSALIGAGTNLYNANFANDIDGDAWPSSGAWDIGFDYYVAAAGGLPTISSLTAGSVGTDRFTASATLTWGSGSATLRWIAYPASYGGAAPTFTAGGSWTTITGAITDSEAVDTGDTTWTAAAPTTGATQATEYKLRAVAEDGTTVGSYADMAGTFTTAATRVATTSLSAAVQLSRQATASLSAAVQTTPSASASVQSAVQAARSAQSSLDAAVLQARTASAALGAAVQAAGAPVSASLDAAVQLVRSATAALDIAVQAQGAQTTSLSAQVQAGSTVSVAVAAAVLRQAAASAGVDLAVQASGAQTTALTAALQVARNAAAAIDAAVQMAHSAGASLSAQVQDGSSRSAALDAAVRQAATAASSVQAAVSTAGLANLSLGAAVSLQRSVAAAIEAAILHRPVLGAGLSAYVFDSTVASVLEVWRATSALTTSAEFASFITTVFMGHSGIDLERGEP